MKPGLSAPERVSTLELFFDLVFVFTITQVSTIIVQSPDVEGVARAAIQLGVIYWMYDGYAWMTNAAGPDTWQRTLLLLIGMAGFFLCALAVPGAFGDDGIVFGVGYLAVIVVHLIGFLLRPGATPVASIYGMAPGNLISAGLLLAAGWVRGTTDWVLWTSAMVLQIATPVLTRRIQGFEFNAAHFAERHGGLILIVFGESLLSVGLAAKTRKVDLALVVGALAGLAATAAMWWAYFVGDNTRGAQAFAAAPPKRRVIQVLMGYELATAVMIFGVIAVAAGTRLRVFDLMSPTPAFEAWLIAQGALLFLLGSAAFRLALRFGSLLPRVLGALLCLVAVPASQHGSAAAGLLVIAAVIAATLAVEHAYEHDAGSEEGVCPRTARALHREHLEVPMSWIDISVAIRDGMVHWPDNPPIVVEKTMDMAHGAVANVSKIAIGVHTATHMDAPCHFKAGAAAIDQLPFEAGVGSARVIAIRDPERITVAELEPHGIGAGERILFKTANSPRAWRSAKFVEDAVYLTIEAARWLAARKVRTIGIDYLSVGGFAANNGASVHEPLLAAGVAIIEGLDLSDVPPGPCDLICLPIKLAGGDGAPARAFVRPHA